MRAGRRRAGAIAVSVLAVSVAACGTESDEGSRAPVPVRAASAGEATALRVTAAPTPRLELPRYQTRGDHPQVAGGDADLAAVNAALTSAVRRHQRATARRFGEEDRTAPPPPAVGNSGLYETSIDRLLISASTKVVSVLAPVTARRPGGNGGRTWVSVTVRVPSAGRVSLTQLFRQADAGMATLAKAAQARVVSANRCIRDGLRDPDVGSINAEGFAPVQRNYRAFALTPRGLAVGFSTGSIGATACGRVVALVPYDALRPHLSDLGEELVSGVRAPLP